MDGPKLFKRLSLRAIPIILYTLPLFHSELIAQKCKSFFNYKSATIDVQGLQISLKKNGSSTAQLSVGAVHINPKYTVVSEKLQQLDLLQKTLCEQIKEIKDDSLRNARRSDFIATLLDMIKISNNPDSLVEQRLLTLEVSDSIRKKTEDSIATLKKTPPDIKVVLYINKQGLNYAVQFLNDVPIIIKGDVFYENRQGIVSNRILGETTLYPQAGIVRAIHLSRKITDRGFPTENEFKLRLILSYRSIYANETGNSKLRKGINQLYNINRSEGTATLINE